MRLSEVQTGRVAIIHKVGGDGAFRKRILEMGFIEGKQVEVIQNAPLKDPIYYRIMNYNVSLRRKDASLIEVLLQSEEKSLNASQKDVETATFVNDTRANPFAPQREIASLTKEEGKKIRVALVGNPNCGKTSLFNLASGAHEHVGNYSGVTVEAKEAYFKHKGYTIEIVDLPGSYSLSPYSPDELFIRKYLSDLETRPDVVVDVVDTCNLERNLYLTMQIKEMNLPVVVALNMFDEFEKSQSKLDIPKLSQLLDTPLIPTVGRVARGIDNLFDAVIELASKKDKAASSVKIAYGNELEGAIETLSTKMEQHLDLSSHTLPPRYIAVKLLEEDQEIIKFLKPFKNSDYIFSALRYEQSQIAKRLGDKDTESRITDARYGFIAGALRETFKPHKRMLRSFTEKVDHILINPILGFPIFLLFLYFMFQTTFKLGEYPMGWIEDSVNWLANMVNGWMGEGPLRDLICDGIIQGVGGVIIFLPQILILYFFISMMEDTGYMSRATFMMDKLMHLMGLHGKSFIPLIMGFGCNVPAIMATRTIESRQSRLITILVAPLMSCGARLPVYILIAGACFGSSAGTVLFAMYMTGILLAVLLARIFRKSFFSKEDIPFVMELPPYRIPTAKSVLIHMWEKAKEYLQKMGTVILTASVIIWVLGYFPREEVLQERDAKIEQVTQSWNGSKKDLAETIQEIEQRANTEQQENSYLGRMGKVFEPVVAPLGFDWKMSIALISGIPAKEVVVSTLGVIYTGDGDDSDEAAEKLSERIRQERNAKGEIAFTPLVALSFMLFILIYFPCVATVVAVGKESGHYKWGLFTILYTCGLAWIVSFIVYQGGKLLGLG